MPRLGVVAALPVMFAAVSNLAYATSYPFYVGVDKNGTEAKIIAVNRGYAPVTVAIDIPATTDDRKNIRPDDIGATARKAVISPRSRQTVLTLRPANPAEPYSFRYNFRWYFGDEAAKHNDRMKYRLPVADGTSVRVAKVLNGLNGGIGHQYDVDLVVPEWTPVVSARAGVVFDVRGYHEGDDAADGAAPSQERDENVPLGDLVRVLHDDGTYAQYTNLMPSSVLVRPGQQISAGEKLAFAGKGNAPEPVLHFGVYAPSPYHEASAVPWFFYTKQRNQIRPFQGDTLIADYSMPDEAQAPSPAPARKSTASTTVFDEIARPLARSRAQDDNEAPPKRVERKIGGGEASKDSDPRTKYLWSAVIAFAVAIMVLAYRKQHNAGSSSSGASGASEA